MTVVRRAFTHPAAGEHPDRAPLHHDLLHSFEALFANEALTRAVLIDALARKADGVVLLAQHGEIAFINATARDILQEADGLTFADGRFVTARLPETQQLHRSILDVREAAMNGGERRHARVLVTRPSGKAPYIVCISPVPENSATPGGGGNCVVHIFDLASQATLSKEAACATFGLSDREGDLAVELTRSGNLKAAARAGMALNTARNHMRSVFAKCRVHSQMELSRILAKLI
jgi:DNA-binding CsgD family transcriptional regulator